MIHIHPEILKRYATGDCSPEERELVEQWLDQEEAGVEEKAVDQGVFTGIDREGLKKNIWQDIKPAQSPKRSKSHISSPAYKMAACFILVFFAGYLSYRYHKQPQQEQPVTGRMTYRELAVPKGRKAKIMLSDGTVIQVNSDSRISYPLVFTSRQRVVYLSGEAYFTVAKDPSKPFIIHTANTETRVLGTVFNIKAYPEEQATTLTVEEGRVRFSLKSDTEKQLILTADQQGILGKENVPVMRKTDAARYTAWKDSELVLENLSLKDIIPLLNRWYGVKVTVRNREIGNERFTGTYREASLSSVANDISQALHCHYQINNNSLIFY